MFQKKHTNKWALYQHKTLKKIIVSAMIQFKIGDENRTMLKKQFFLKQMSLVQSLTVFTLNLRLSNPFKSKGGICIYRFGG